jgi:hypothetical protein
MVLVKILRFIVYWLWTKYSISQAKAKKLLTRKRHWVLQLKGRIYVFNKAQIRYHIKKGTFREGLNFIILDKIAIYDTH